MSKQPGPATLDEYLAPLSPGIREILETVRRTVKEEVPAVVGDPLSNPPADRAMPAGRFPEAIDHVIGGSTEAASCME